MTTYNLPSGKTVKVMTWDEYQWEKKVKFFKETGETDLLSLLRKRNGK